MKNNVKGGLNKTYKVNDLLNLLKKYKKYDYNPISVEVIPIGHSTTYRLNVNIYHIIIDKKYNTITLSNYLTTENYREDHSVSKIINTIKDYPDYDIIIEIENSSSDIIFKDYARACFIGFDKLRECVQLFTLTPSPDIKI